MIHPFATTRARWDQAEPDLRRYTRSVAVAGGLGVIAYLLVLWDFGWHPLRTAIGGADFSGFYDLQTRQLFHGHLDVPRSILGLEAFAVRGREFMYFPPGPSLLRAPFFLFTDRLDSKFTAFSMLAAWIVAAVLIALLMWRVRLLLRGRTGLGRAEAVGFGLLLFSLMAGSVVLYLGSLPFVYHEAYAWAIAMALGATFATIGLLERPSNRGALTAGAFTLGAILSRTTSGWACAGGLILAALWFASGRSHQVLPRRWVATLFAAAFVPLVVGIILNWAKFRHPYFFPLQDQIWTGMSAQRRAALAANGGDLVSPNILPATVMGYFRPDGIRFSTLFPYITLPAEVPQNYGGSFLDQMYRTGSVVAFMPVLVLLSIWGLITTFRRGVKREIRNLRIPLLAVLAIPLPIMFYGYIAMRYTAEFIPLFALAGSIGFVDIARRGGPHPKRARLAFGILAVLVVFGFAANLAVSVTSARLANPGTPLTQYVRVQTILSDRTPGRPLDRLIRQSPTLPRSGPADRIQIVGDCRAVYIGSGDPLAPWIPFEIQPLEWDLDLSTTPTTPTTLDLAQADGVAGDGLQLEFDGAGRYRGTFTSTTGVAVGRWRSVPPGGVHLRLFAYLTEHLYILIDVERPARGLVDLPLGQLDQTPYRQQLTFHPTDGDDPAAGGLTLTPRKSTPPPLCPALRERIEPGGG